MDFISAIKELMQGNEVRKVYWLHTDMRLYKNGSDIWVKYTDTAGNNINRPADTINAFAHAFDNEWVVFKDGHTSSKLLEKWSKGLNDYENL